MINKFIVLIALFIGLGFMLVPYDALLLYKRKRNFNISPEPPRDSQSKKKKHPIFVVQKHNASHLHYDFRLEINGVLKSWAVPKGPSTDPDQKRLAIETEDHPMSYATFEGMIPEGQYGAGSVIVWDTGTFTNIKEKDNKTLSMLTCYKKGHIEVDLHGEKLQGNYALIRTTYDNDKKKWLLIKMDDAHVNNKKDITETHPASVLSGKTIEDIELKKKQKK